MALIDCGLQFNPNAILKRMALDGLDTGKLRRVLLTHTHPDHANAAKWLKETMGVEIWTSAFEAQALEKGLLNVLGFRCIPSGYEPFDQIPKVSVSHVVEDGEVFRVGELEVKAIVTPGHTPGSVCYMMESDKKRNLFCGDEVFYHGFISLLTHPLSSYEQYKNGLERLRGLQVDGLFPSHLLWTLDGGQMHIDQALSNFEIGQRPVLKPFS